MTPEDINVLYGYNAWANRRQLEAASKLSNDQFTKPLGSSFSSVRDTLAHIYGAERIWLERFLGHPAITLPDPKTFPDLAALRDGWTSHEEELLRFVRGLTQADLDHEFSYKSLKGEPFRNPLVQSLQHLANHGTYHRGQVTTLLRQLGVPAVSTDLMQFYRERAQSAAA